MEFDYFLIFAVLVFIVMMFAVFGKRSQDLPYGDQYYTGNPPPLYPQQQAPPPPQPIVIITKNESARSFGGGEGFAALLIISLAIYFYVTETEENPKVIPAPVNQQQSVPAPIVSPDSIETITESNWN